MSATSSSPTSAASIGPEKEAPGVLAIEVELAAELATAPTGRTVTPIRTAGGGNPAVLTRYRHWPFCCCSSPVS